MIKLMMAVVWLSGHVDHVELTGSKYANLRECQAHVRQLSFTTNTERIGGNKARGSRGDFVVGGGFYCDVR